MFTLRPLAPRFFIALLLAAVLPSAALAASDAVVEAKRRAANDLIRTNKTADGIALLREVVALDDKNFRDFLALARAHDKLNASAEALTAYRKVLALVPTDSKSPEERAARGEAERRVKVLDQQSAKIDLTVEETLKKIIALEKEAETARATASAERLYRIHAALLQADARPDRGGAEVQASRFDWTVTHFILQKGKSYRVQCKGVWRLSARGDEECTADGLTKREFNGRPAGCVVASAPGAIEFATLGRDTTFVSPVDGQLIVTCWEKGDEKKDNSGSIFLLIDEVK